MKTTLLYIFLCSFLFISCQTENSHKQFFVDNVELAEKYSENIFIIDSLDSYYTEKSLRFLDDSSFVIICWGNRDSFWWNIRKDKKISVSIPFDRHKGKNVDLDIKLIELFHPNNNH